MIRLSQQGLAQNPISPSASSSASSSTPTSMPRTSYILLLRDLKGSKFGGFIANCSLGNSGEKYYGNGDFGVFSFKKSDIQVISVFM